MRRLALSLVALALVLGCSRGSELRPAGASAAAPASAATPAPQLPGLAANPVLAPDGSARIERGSHVLVDPETGEALPSNLIAVLETGPGGPVVAGAVDLLFEEPAHRGRIPITLSSASVIDLEPMQAGAMPLARPDPLPRPAPSVFPSVPAARAPDLD
jgi:hypothetical protein